MTNGKFFIDISEILGNLYKNLTGKISEEDFKVMVSVSRNPENIAAYIYGGKYIFKGSEVKTSGLLDLKAEEGANPLFGDNSMSLSDPLVAFIGPVAGYNAGIAYERLGESDIMSASAELGGHRDMMIPISGYIWAVALSLLGGQTQTKEERKE
jgi:hypothetical protein